MNGQIILKTFEKLTEEEMEKAIEFIFSKEEQEYFSLDKEYEEEIDPDFYIFITDSCSDIIGLVKIQKENNMIIINLDEEHILDKVIELEDFRIRTDLSHNDKEKIIKTLFNYDFDLFSRFDLKDYRYIGICPELTKIAYFEDMIQALKSDSLFCYKKINN